METTSGNHVTLLKNGGEFFPALIAAVDAAEFEIRIETYIFRDDKSGLMIAESLKRAAKRGVTVCVLVDGFGSNATSADFFEQLRVAGVTLLLFRPDFRLLSFRRAHLRRTHRKIVVIDTRIAFVGGINLIDDLTESLSPYPRYDYAVRVEGPALAGIQRATERLWNLVSWWHVRKMGAKAEIRRWRGLLKQPQSETVLAKNKRAALMNLEEKNGGGELSGKMRTQFLARDNFRNRREIEEAYLDAIKNAKQKILIVNSYFLPGRRFRRELIAAATRGVEVTLLLQGRADHALLQMATRALYEQLLGAGVKIYEYEKSMLHGKVAAIDDAWATVGSSNLDPFSLFLNREANMVVLDEAFARNLRLSVQAEISESARHCDPADWQRRPLIERMKTWFAYGFARAATGWIGVKGDWLG
jgi:cardiolipin synthase A/B